VNTSKNYVRNAKATRVANIRLDINSSTTEKVKNTVLHQTILLRMRQLNI